MRNAPASGPLDRRYRMPPIKEASPAGSPPPSGRSAGSRATVMNATAKQMTFSQ